jgi:hypothetical protein
MNTSTNEPGKESTVPTAQAMFEHERLPFPPMPAQLAASLQQQGPGWFATRPLTSTPYDFGHFLAELQAQPDLPDYAVVGFDGHGTNSWAVHFYLVSKGIALFIQLPWGGAYLEPEPARAEITALFDWAKALLSRLRLAESAGKIPDGMRLEVAASRFSHAGWRWLSAGQDAAAIPWNPSAGMKAAMLQELDDVIGGRRLLKASRSQ